MPTDQKKIDSNISGLRYSEETSFKVANGSAVWYPLGPNSYGDFGGTAKLVSSNPINPSRQLKKGVVVDLEASGNLSTDFTQTNLQDILQGFMYADYRRKDEFSSFTSVTSGTKTYGAASGLTIYGAGELVFCSGFTNATNNGLKTVVSSTATTVVVAETCVTETPTAGAKMVRVGFKMGSAELNVDASGTNPVLNRASGTVDFTTFGIIPGEWIFIGGDSAGLKFVNAANNCYARVKSVTTTAITLDKTTTTMVTETGTGLTIQLFMARVLKNESGSLIKRRTYQLERTLGAPDSTQPSQIQSQYLVGAVPSELKLMLKTADKMTADLTFLAGTTENRTGVTGVKSGTRPTLADAPIFNTSRDIYQMKLGATTSPNPTGAFAYLSEAELTLNNSLDPNKAIGVLGSFDITAGTFKVDGKLTAYFQDVTALDNIIAATDLTFHAITAKSNAGFVIDLPMVTLGDGKVKVEQDKSITVPLDINATSAANYDTNMDHTMLWCFFDYLPTLAMPV